MWCLHFLGKPEAKEDPCRQIECLVLGRRKGMCHFDLGAGTSSLPPDVWVCRDSGGVSFGNT